MNLKTLTSKVEKVTKNYTSKFDITPDTDWYILKLQEELGELIQAYLMMEGKARKKGKTKEQLKEDFESEVADVLCHVLLLSKHHKIDLEKIIEKKWLVWIK